MSSHAENEEEEDYMKMAVEDPTPAKETPFQRTQRLKKESRARGVIKSKAQLAEEEAAARQKALSTSMLDDPRAKKSKGLAMMSKMGFAGGGLGKKTDEGAGGSGRTEPITLEIKGDRGGIGLDAEKKRRLQEEAGEKGIKAVKLDPDEYRNRVRKEREEARLEMQFHAAQRMAERLDEEEPADSGASETAEVGQDGSKMQKARSTFSRTRPLKSIPALYRGLVRYREEQERDRRMRHVLEQSLSRLPTYEDDDADADDKQALGQDETAYDAAEDLDQEDEELDQFNSLEVEVRLTRVLEYLRRQHHYCFWCKMAYPTQEMEGCPGGREEDHD